MNCIVTAGPTSEPMDQVRRLTNSSTGRLGAELANHFVSLGHSVTLLIGGHATYCGERRAQRIESFSSTTELRDRLCALSSHPVQAVFHAAAVSDFSFGKIWRRSPAGEVSEIKSGKISTQYGALLAELVPTPKILASLREWFPEAKLAGWKFEVEGGREGTLAAGRKQLADCRTDACVLNGPAYGEGFGLLRPDGRCDHIAGHEELYAALADFLESGS